MTQPGNELHQEIELKYRFPSSSTFERVKKTAMNLSGEKEFIVLQQNNYFFDTADFILREHSLTIRLREENQKFILCMKGDDPKVSKNQKSMTIKLEYEDTVSATVANDLLSQQYSPVEYLRSKDRQNAFKNMKTLDFLCQKIEKLTAHKSLNIVGSFTNQRTCIPIHIAHDTFLLEMDETTFKPSVVHYEAELEIPDSLYQNKAETFLLELFHEAKAEYFISNGKAERFFQHLTPQ